MVSRTNVKKLFAASKNICAFKDCAESIYEAKHDSVIGDICHIRAKNEGGPRYDPTYPKEKNDDYENLILLCKKHHKIIDDNPDEFSIEVLTEIKMSHEQRGKPIDEPLNELVERLIKNMQEAIENSRTRKRENASIEQKREILLECKRVLRKSTLLLKGHLRHLIEEGDNYESKDRTPMEIGNIINKLSILSSIGNVDDKAKIKPLKDEGVEYGGITTTDQFIELEKEITRWANKANAIDISLE